MIMALGWLTISTPFVYNASQECKKITAQSQLPEEEESNNPFANTTEEKTESSFGSISEYLHDHETVIISNNDLLRHAKCHDADVYIAFHGELLTPPPEILS